MNTNKQKIIEKITEQIKPLIKEKIMEGFKAELGEGKRTHRPRIDVHSAPSNEKSVMMSQGRTVSKPHYKDTKYATATAQKEREKEKEKEKQDLKRFLDQWRIEKEKKPKWRYEDLPGVEDLKNEDAVDTAMKKTETGPMERGLEILRKKVDLIPGAQKKSEFILQIMPKMGIDAETLAAIANRVKTGAKQAGRDGKQQAGASDPAAAAVSAELES